MSDDGAGMVRASHVDKSDRRAATRTPRAAARSSSPHINGHHHATTTPHTTAPAEEQNDTVSVYRTPVSFVHGRFTHPPRVYMDLFTPLLEYLVSRSYVGQAWDADEEAYACGATYHRKPSPYVKIDASYGSGTQEPDKGRGGHKEGGLCAMHEETDDEVHTVCLDEKLVQQRRRDLWRRQCEVLRVLMLPKEGRRYLEETPIPVTGRISDVAADECVDNGRGDSCHLPQPDTYTNTSTSATATTITNNNHNDSSDKYTINNDIHVMCNDSRSFVAQDSQFHPLPWQTSDANDSSFPSTTEAAKDAKNEAVRDSGILPDGSTSPWLYSTPHSVLHGSRYLQRLRQCILSLAYAPAFADDSDYLVAREVLFAVQQWESGYGSVMHSTNTNTNTSSSNRSNNNDNSNSVWSVGTLTLLQSVELDFVTHAECAVELCAALLRDVMATRLARMSCTRPPRILRLCRRLHMTPKETAAMTYLLLCHCGRHLIFGSGGAAALIPSSIASVARLTPRELLHFLCATRPHMKQGVVVFDLKYRAFVDYKLTMSAEVIAALTGQPLTEEQQIKLENTALLAMIRHEEQEDKTAHKGRAMQRRVECCAQSAALSGPKDLVNTADMAHMYMENEANVHDGMRLPHARDVDEQTDTYRSEEEEKEEEHAKTRVRAEVEVRVGRKRTHHPVDAQEEEEEDDDDDERSAYAERASQRSGVSLGHIDATLEPCATVSEVLQSLTSTPPLNYISEDGGVKHADDLNNTDADERASMHDDDDDDNNNNNNNNNNIQGKKIQERLLPMHMKDGRAKSSTTIPATGSESSVNMHTPYAHDMEYMDAAFKLLAHLIRVRSAEGEMKDEDDGAAVPRSTMEATLRELKGRVRVARAVHESRIKATRMRMQQYNSSTNNSNHDAPFEPRMEQLARRLGLSAFEKQVLLLMLGNVISHDVLVAINGRYVMREGQRVMTVGFILFVLCDGLPARVRSRRAFYKSAPLIAHGIVALSLESNSRSCFDTDLMDYICDIDRKMVDFLMGVETETSELVPGSRLFVPRVSLSGVVLPPRTTALVRSTVTHYALLEKCRRLCGLNENSSERNALNNTQNNNNNNNNNNNSSSSGSSNKNESDAVEKPKEDNKSIIVHTKHNNTSSNVFSSSFGSSGAGLVLLFHGPSGTGKTMLANAVAHEVGKKLLLVNVSQFRSEGKVAEVMRFLFREAKLNNAVVFFDECESLFESRESNPLLTGLLAEFERYDGLVILATNKAHVLDDAMNRRVSLMVEFTLPDYALRAAIWRAHLPTALAHSPDLCVDTLALNYELSGGMIRNAVHAALGFAVAREESATPTLTMADCERGARRQLRGFFLAARTHHMSYADSSSSSSNRGANLDYTTNTNKHDSTNATSTTCNDTKNSGHVETKTTESTARATSPDSHNGNEPNETTTTAKKDEGTQNNNDTNNNNNNNTSGNHVSSMQTLAASSIPQSSTTRAPPTSSTTSNTNSTNTNTNNTNTSITWQHDSLAECSYGNVPTHTLDELVTTAPNRHQLLRIVHRIQSRATLIAQWGFSEAHCRGNEGSLLYLFYGPRGTGKSLAAEGIASACHLTLRVGNLAEMMLTAGGGGEVVMSAMMTQLTSLFEEARQLGAMVVIDRAELLFTPHSERSVQVGQLIQYHAQFVSRPVLLLATTGVTVAYYGGTEGNTIRSSSAGGGEEGGWTTSVSAASLDVHAPGIVWAGEVRFAMPGTALRERLWRAAFPSRVPMHGDVDFAALSRRAVVSGKMIRQVAFRACCRAAMRLTRQVTMGLIVEELEEAVMRERSRQPLGRMFA